MKQGAGLSEQGTLEGGTGAQANAAGQQRRAGTGRRMGSRSLGRRVAVRAMRVVLAAMWFALIAQCALAVATTAVADTVYLANGSAASGTILISWPTFTTAAGEAVPAGMTTVAVAANGAFSVALAPNLGAVPAGVYYTVVMHLAGSPAETEYWVVPSTGTTTLAAIRSKVMPVTRAVPVGGGITSTAGLVQKAGDSMLGPLTLSGDPTAAAQASTKNYVDTQVGAQQTAITAASALAGNANTAASAANVTATAAQTAANSAIANAAAAQATANNALSNAATAQATAANAIPLAQKAAASGVASLDASGLVPVAQVPALAEGKITGLTTDLATNASAAASAQSSANAAQATANAALPKAGGTMAGKLTLSGGLLAGRSDMVDVVADGGLVGNNSANCVSGNMTGCVDEGAAMQTLINNNVGKWLFFKHTSMQPNGCDFYSSVRLTIKTGTLIEGSSPTLTNGAAFCFPSGVAGINATTTGGGYSHLDGLRLYGGDPWVPTNLATYVLPASFGGTGPNTDGLVISGQTKVSNVSVQFFARHCITLDTAQTAGSDAAILENITVSGCRGDGLNFNGSDAQVGSVNVVSASANQLYGIRMNGWANYGNTVIDPNTRQNHHVPSPVGVALNGTVAGMSCVGPTAVQLSGTCTVTMTAANTLYVNDQVNFAGVSGDSGLNGAPFIIASVADTTHFTFPYNVTETIVAGGTATYDQYYHVWAAAGTNGLGGNYGHGGSGSNLYLGCYSESTDTNGTFTGGSSSYDFCINPQGSVPLDGIQISNWYSHIFFPEGMVIHENVAAPALTTRFNSVPDNYNAAFVTLYNGKPGGLFTNIYSDLLKGTRSAWGNVSGWWCDSLPGNSGTALSLADMCEMDALTVTGRTAVDGHGGALFPNGYFMGNPSAGLQYTGWAGAVPTTGTWTAGDRIYNNGLGGTPITTVFLWLCTTGGPAGTFVFTPQAFSTAAVPGAGAALGFSSTGTPAWSFSNPQINLGFSNGLYSGSNALYFSINSTAAGAMLLQQSLLRLSSAMPLCWSSTGTASTAGCDAGFSRFGAGLMLAGNGTFGDASGVVEATGFQLVGSSKTCTAAIRGQLNYVAGAAGTKDVVQVCAKDATDVYAWRAIY